MNLEKHCINKINNHESITFFIDIGNQLVKIGYANQDNELIITKFNTNTITNNDLLAYFKHKKVQKVYIGSVVKKLNKLFIDFFKEQNIECIFIKNEWFLEYITLNPNIDIKEIGSDILAFCLLISDFDNALCINFGTATVLFSYINYQLSGVMIGNNYSSHYQHLYEILGIDLFKLEKDINQQYQYNFETNTVNALISYIDNNINGMIDYLLINNQEINQIIVSGGDKHLFSTFYKNNHQKPIKIINEATLYGYFLLISKKFQDF